MTFGVGVEGPSDFQFWHKVLHKHLGMNAGFNEIDFAKSIAPKFVPSRARLHSSSFRYFWELVESKARHR